MSKPTLIKVYDETCQVCKKLDKDDRDLAMSRDFAYGKVDVADLSTWPEDDPLRSYVVNYHVAPNDGMIDLPVYVIVNNGDIQGSGVVKELEEISNLINSWEVWSKLQSSESPTK